MKKILLVLQLVILSLSVIGIAACTNTTTTNQDELTLNITSKKIIVGSSFTIIPSTENPVTYRSSNETVATVSADGLVLGVSLG